MSLARWKNTLFLNTSLTLVFGLLSYTLASLFLVFHFIIAPIVNRAADDLGALMHTITLSWVALPSSEKAAFQSHLREQHQLFITDKEVEVTDITIAYPFLPKLEEALLKHIGATISIKQDKKIEHCYWVFISQDDWQVAIGFLHERLGAQPPKAVVGVLIAAGVLIFITTLFLVKSITTPIATFSRAVNLVGSGQLMTKIPEQGAKEIVDLARNFNQMTQQISELISDRNLLFAGISHDLRTPITRMNIALELVEGGQNDKLLEGMGNDLEDMENLIAQTLDLVKGMSSQEAVYVEINELMTGLVKSYARQGCKIEWECQYDQPWLIEVNALRRVLFNLLDNAFRYSKNKTVEFHCLRVGEKLLFKITDQGCGIPEDKLEAVFHPFYRLENSRSKQTGGSGLGLAVVKQLCDVHQWKIQLINRDGGLEARLEIGILL